MDRYHDQFTEKNDLGVDSSPNKRASIPASKKAPEPERFKDDMLDQFLKTSELMRKMETNPVNLIWTAWALMPEFLGVSFERMREFIGEHSKEELSAAVPPYHGRRKEWEGEGYDYPDVIHAVKIYPDYGDGTEKPVVKISDDIKALLVIEGNAGKEPTRERLERAFYLGAIAYADEEGTLPTEEDGVFYNGESDKAVPVYVVSLWPFASPEHMFQIINFKGKEMAKNQSIDLEDEDFNASLKNINATLVVPGKNPYHYTCLVRKSMSDRQKHLTKYLQFKTIYYW